MYLETISGTGIACRREDTEVLLCVLELFTSVLFTHSENTHGAPYRIIVEFCVDSWGRKQEENVPCKDLRKGLRSAEAVSLGKSIGTREMMPSVIT